MTSQIYSEIQKILENNISLTWISSYEILSHHLLLNNQWLCSGESVKYSVHMTNDPTAFKDTSTKARHLQTNNVSVRIVK